MLRTETVSPRLLEVLHQLMKMKSIKDFRLVGGTALSLQAGHRISLDIDLFVSTTFDKQEVKKEIEDVFLVSTPDKESSFGLSYHINGIKTEMYHWHVPFIKPIINEGGIRFSALEDIAALKLDAIKSRQEKKDFIDIVCLFDTFSLAQMLDLYQQKYRTSDKRYLLDALSNIDKADESLTPKMLNDLTWDEVKGKVIFETRKFILEEKKQ